MLVMILVSKWGQNRRDNHNGGWVRLEWRELWDGGGAWDIILISNFKNGRGEGGVSKNYLHLL